MPCLCGHKVDRSSAKVQCAKCNELYHLSCVNILPSDVEFLLSSDKEYLCIKCSTARRNSLRSPPLLTTLVNAENNSSPACPNSSTSPKSETDVQRSTVNILSLHPTTMPNTISPCQQELSVCGHINRANNCDQLTLQSALYEIAALRAENSRIVAMVNELREVNTQLLTNTQTMQAEVQLLQSNLRFDEMASAISSLTAEIRAMREIACTCVHKNAKESKKGNDHFKKSSLSASTVVIADSPVLPCSASAVGVSVNPSLRLPDALSFAAAADKITDKVSGDFDSASSAVGVNVNTSPTFADTNSLSFAAAAAAVNNTKGSGVSTASHHSAQWSTATGKRLKKQKKSLDVVYGVNCSTELDVVAMKKWIHLSSFKPTVSAEDIIGYVAKNTTIDKSLISCFSLIKKDVDVSSLKRINFKLGVVTSAYDQVLNPALWPANVKVRPFQNFQKDDPPNNKV